MEAAFVEANYTVDYAHYLQHHRLVNHAAGVLAGKAQAMVLDLGCSQGINLFALHRKLLRDAIRYMGIDLDRAALVRAANRCAYRGYTNIEFKVGDVLRTSLPAGSADLILSSEVIEHLREPRVLLEEIRRVLAPGGIALITTPNLSNYPRRAGDWVDRRLNGGLRERAYAGMVDRGPGSGFSPEEAAGILGHVSEKPAKAWRKLAQELEFDVQLRRGSTLVYGYPWLARHPMLFGLLCLADGLLELTPWWYDTSHDLFMVLRKRTTG